MHDLLQLRRNPYGAELAALRQIYHEDEAFYHVFMGETSPVGTTWTQDVPMQRDEYLELHSRLPDVDFIPETVVDPRQRAMLRRAIDERKRNQRPITQKHENRWGTAAVRLSPTGKTITVPNPFGSGAGNATTTIALPSAAHLFQWDSGDNDPHPLAIGLSYSADFPDSVASGFSGSNTGDVTQLYARVEWGTGGARHLAWVDIGNGTQLNVSGTFLRLSAFYAGALVTVAEALPSPSSFSQIGPSVTVNATVAPSVFASRRTSARYTFKVAMPGAPAFLNFPIPPFATSFGYATAALPGAGGGKMTAQTLTFILLGPPTTAVVASTNTAPTIAYDSTMPPNAFFASDETFPIPNGYTQMQIATSSAVANAVLTVFFEIML